MHVQHHACRPDREHDDRPEDDQPDPHRPAHDRQDERSKTPARRPSRRAHARTETTSTAALTRASTGRWRSAAALAASVINPLSSTVITRNIAARTLRRAKATTITTKATSRKTAGPSTVQSRSQNATQPGWATPKSCRGSRANRSMASTHVHCCASRPTSARTAQARPRRGRRANLSAVSPHYHYPTLPATVHLWLCFCANCCAFGGLPAELRTQVDAEGIIYLAEYLPVTRRFSGSVPGKKAKTEHLELCRLAGAHPAARAGHAVVGAQARRPHHRPAVGRAAGRARQGRHLDTGLHIEVDIGEVDPKFNGHLSLNYKTPIPDDVLMRLPRRSLAFEVPPEYVLRAVGVPYRPQRLKSVGTAGVCPGRGSFDDVVLVVLAFFVDSAGPVLCAGATCDGAWSAPGSALQ